MGGLAFGRFASTMFQALFWTLDIMVSKPDVYYHTAYALVLTNKSVIVIFSDTCEEALRKWDRGMVSF